MSAPADWYPDTQRPGQLRYWDGHAWTEHRAPAGEEATAKRVPPSRVAAASSSPATLVTDKIPLFGARNAAKEANTRLRDAQAEVSRLSAELERTGALEILGVCPEFG